MMKRIISGVSLFMSVVILFAILFQSVDSYEHLAKKLSQKECHHKIELSTQITHQHVGFEKCFVCDFAFSTYLKSSLQVFTFIKSVFIFSTNSYFTQYRNYFYSGIPYSLRGPPKF